MAKCKNCKHLGYLSDGDQVGKRVWCENITDSPDFEMERDCDNYAHMTNADRIRSMTDKELAKLFAEVETGTYIADKKGYSCSECTEKINCDVCYLEWLKEESEE